MQRTRHELLALPQHSLRTSTSVTDGQPRFEGLLIGDLLEQLVARVLNDYRIKTPRADLEDYAMIGDLSINGAPLSPRDKRPVLIVYPRDDHPELADIRYDTRWRAYPVTVSNPFSPYHGSDDVPPTTSMCQAGSEVIHKGGRSHHQSWVI